jgi:hypothetical protein
MVGRNHLGLPSLPAPAKTRAPLNAGRCFSIGSLASQSPSSWRMLIATPVTGLVIEKIRKMVSSCAASPEARSFLPMAFVRTTWPWRAVSVTAPASSPASISPWMVASIASNPSVERPTD